LGDSKEKSANTSSPQKISPKPNIFGAYLLRAYKFNIFNIKGTVSPDF
jgi:hypothetical protein